VNVNYWELARAVRGPIMLITFGVLMAMNHMNTIGFERTWPILIIMYGLLRLWERAAGPPTPPAYPPAGYPPSPYPTQSPNQGGAQ
jgi:hypothetical protein